jgi:4-amino-4-deoxychorismate lyase
MSLLLETIRVVNRTFQSLFYHQQRVEVAMIRHFPHQKPILLDSELVIPEYLDNNIYKCRVLYDVKINKVEFLPYTIRPVQSLALVEIPSDVDYSFKWAERSWLDRLKQSTAADDILMVRNGWLTDTSYANIALWDGYGWFTPRRPLLEGTKRARLLAEGILKIADIKPKDLTDFQYVKLLNAMMDFEESPLIAVQNIQWPVTFL